MPSGISIPRSVHDLPRELVQHNSEIDVLITVASTAGDHRTFNFESTLRVARSVIKKSCPQYQSSPSDANSLLCRSGEEDGSPYRGHSCFSCRASQFSSNGMFVGEMVDSASPSAHTIVPTLMNDSLTLESFIKLLEAS